MEEIFIDIKGYEGLYQVSSLGRVKSLKDNHGCNRGKILKSSKDNYGYLRVNLYKGRKKKTIKIHRLVAETFLDNPHNYPCINHKDEDKANNNVDNLEWCDYKYNNTYGNRIKKAVANTDWKEVSRKTSEKLSKPVLQFTKYGEFVREWSSTNECGRNGFYQGNISKCCNGERKSHKGYIWRYKE